jgi:cyclopropane fatty-acyl-phospholipid synthase-like methyltransferase
MINSKELSYKYDVSGEIHEHDFIYEFIKNHPGFPKAEDAIRHYFSNGNNSAEKLKAILSADLGININENRSFLEFASGYGCVTRHLLKKLPEFEFAASDIHPEANQFLEKISGCKTVQSHKVPEKYPTHTYDIVFALSFFSHMPRTTWSRWLQTLVNRLNINGFLIFTTHGLASHKMMNSPILEDDGFWFQNNSEQSDLETTDYGTTITSPLFVLNEIHKIKDCKIRLLKTEHWWTHQDLYAVQKISL